MRKGRWQPGALENGGPQMSSRRQWPGLGSQPPLLQSHLPPRRSNRVLSWTPGQPGRASVASGCDHETMLWPRRHERKLQTVLNLRTLCLAKSAVLIPSLWAGRQICDDSATWEGWGSSKAVCGQEAPGRPDWWLLDHHMREKTLRLTEAPPYLGLLVGSLNNPQAVGFQLSFKAEVGVDRREKGRWTLDKTVMRTASLSTNQNPCMWTPHLILTVTWELWIHILSPFYSRGHWCPERLSNLAKVIE